MAKKNSMTVQEYKTSLIEALIPYKKKELERTKKFIADYIATVRSKDMTEEQKEAIFRQRDNFESVNGRTVTAHEYERSLVSDIDRLEAEAAPTDQKFFNMHLYSDITPYACVKEFSPNKVGVIRMDTTAGPTADGMGHQDWICTKPANWTEDDMVILTRRKNGLFYKVGDRSCPCTVSKEPLRYYDWSF